MENNHTTVKQTGKKYLLYIHHPAFSHEKHKSALVNKLLAQHYGLDSPMEKHKKELVKETYDKAMETNGFSVSQPAQDPDEEDVFGLCSHGKEPLLCMHVGCENNPNN